MNKNQSDFQQSLLESDQAYTQKIVKYKRGKIGGQNIFSSLLFLWPLKLLKLGSSKAITVEDMPQLKYHQKTQEQFIKLKQAFENTKKGKKGSRLIKALLKSYYKAFLGVLFLVAITASAEMFNPFLTSFIMKYIQQKQLYESSHGIYLFILAIFCSFIKTLSQNHFIYRVTLLGVNISNTITMMIYNKALKYPNLADKKFTQGQILNYSQVDAERVSSLGYQGSSLLVAPLQIIFGIIMMYLFIGISFLSGIGVMIILFLITFFVTKRNVSLNQQLLKVKDSRMKSTQQMLDIIRYIKINALQKFFYKKIDTERTKEIQLYKKKGLMDVLSIFFYWLACPLILSATFFTYIYLGNQMNSYVAFTTIMIFSTLQYPIRLVPTAISSFVQILTSLYRIQAFLQGPQIQSKNYNNIGNQQSQHAIIIERGNFYWGVQKQKQQNKQQKKKKKNQQIKGSQTEINSKKQLQQDNQNNTIINGQTYSKILFDINTKIKKNSTTIILGDIGSGKSSFLLSILNQMITDQQTRVTISGSVSYACQKPWIMSSTVKNNITFQNEWNQIKFKNVIRLACLQNDIKMLPKGIDTDIGQKGINLSGGQKARIGLARALYADRDIYLLDDVLSAVDVHVADFLMKQTILKHLNNKTVIMPTHAIRYAQLADEIILMKKGRIARKGHFQDIKETQQFRQIFIKQTNQKKNKEQQQDLDPKASAEISFIKNKQKNKQELESNKPKNIIQKLMIQEQHQIGKIDFKIFKQYLKLNGGVWGFGVFIMIAMFLWISCTTASNIIMERWCEDPIGQDYDLYLYIGFSVFSNVFIFVRAYKLILSGASQGQQVHRNMMKSLLYASLGDFFNRVPVGRIINRLTKDLRQLDEEIGFAIGNFIVNLFSLLGTLTICIYSSTLYIFIPITIVLVVSTLLRNFYMKTQRQTTRYQKSTNSPIISGFGSTVSGLSTIRAYGMQLSFQKKQQQLFDINKMVRLTKSGLQNWFSLHLTYISYFVNMTAIGYCILSENQNPSLVGLMMTYAVNLSIDMIYFTSSYARFQTKVISLERIYSFTQIEPEPAYKQYLQKWSPQQQVYDNCVIKQGSISVHNVYARYRMDLPDSLKGINFQIKGGQKIGIVGRTGAGKSTIINTLLGITKISNGEVKIDGNQLSQLSLKQLRHQISMIDQQPTLLKASFRQNLDVTHKYSDQQLIKVLQQCNLKQIMEQKGGLDSMISNQNLSVGQRQLLCICRSFLKKSKLVLVDEATASIDVKNDTLIQDIISTKFKKCTVLTIAHRLTTLQKSDKIMVMENGVIIEYGSPEQLMKIQKGVYRQMIQKNEATKYLK